MPVLDSPSAVRVSAWGLAVGEDRERVGAGGGAAEELGDDGGVDGAAAGGDPAY